MEYTLAMDDHLLKVFYDFKRGRLGESSDGSRWLFVRWPDWEAETQRQEVFSAVSEAGTVCFFVRL